MEPTRPAPPSVNVHVIDEQHAALIAKIDRLVQALAAGETMENVPQIVRDIADYASCHCPAEERLMASCKYPLRDLHAMEHQKFFRRLREIERTLQEGHSTAAIQTLGRLRGWLEHHIVDWDARLGDFLNSCGVG